MNSEWAGDLAVMLNQNAKRVTTRMRRSLENLLPQAQLYTSRTLDEARAQVRDAMDRGYQRIVCGGGDGTIVHLLNQIRDYVEEKNAQVAASGARLAELGQDVVDRIEQMSFPQIGILKLGTGNAFADVVGSRKPKESLLQLGGSRPVPTTRFNLVEAEKRVFHFAGLGYDAAILNDYFAFKARFDKGPLSPWFRTIGGYLTSMALKTIPEQIRVKHRPRVRVTTGEGPVYRVGHSIGQVPMTGGPGEVLYEGPVSVLGAATTPYYGFKLHAFPFARLREGFFNFRIVTAKVPELLRNAVSIFKGKYEGETFIDFLARDVKLEFDRPIPYQVGGDAAGYRESIRYTLAGFSIEVFDFQTA